MRALIWKELRENFKWALLALLVLTGMQYYALTYTEYGYPDYYYNDGITLCRKIFLTVTTFGCIGTGFLLGLIQILPELKRDQWAALLHRPVSRGVIFRGKAFTGLFLYLLATGVPFLFSICMVAAPGNFGVPFVPEMVKPGLADIGAGAMYYFAALALGLNRGGWIGAKILPLLAAIHTTYFIQTSSYFYVAVEAAILMSLLLFVAAWGAIHDQDRLRARPWLGKLAFLAMAFYGMCGLGDLGRSLVSTLVPTAPSFDQRYNLDDAGLPLLVSYLGNVVQKVEDSEGRPLTDPKYKPDRVRNTLNYLNSVSDYVGDTHGWKRRTYHRDYRDSYSYLWSNSPYSYPRLEQWFYLPLEPSYIGFSPRDKTAFARLDAGGFQTVSARPVLFPEEAMTSEVGQDGYLIAGNGNLKYANLAKREISECAVPEPGAIYGIGNAYARNEGQSISVSGVAFRNGLGIYDSKAKLIASLPYGHEVDRWGDLSLGLSTDGNTFFIWYQPSVWIDGKTKRTMPSYVDWVDRQGKVLRSFNLPPLPDFPRGTPLDSILARGMKAPGFYFGTMLYRKIGGELGSERMQRDLDWQFGGGWAGTHKILIWSGAASIILSLVTFFWAIRGQFTCRQALGWSLFVLSLNVAGFLIFRLVADWPRLVSCPCCAGLRPVEWEDCPRCGKKWPEPEPTGTEIFDRASSGAAT